MAPSKIKSTVDLAASIRGRRKTRAARHAASLLGDDDDIDDNNSDTTLLDPDSSELGSDTEIRALLSSRELARDTQNSSTGNPATVAANSEDITPNSKHLNYVRYKQLKVPITSSLYHSAKYNKR